MTTTQKEFIKSIARGAVENLRRYQILPSVTMAQAIVESGWGASGLTKASNNLFGIKANSGWTGKVCNYKTQEFVNGQYVTVYADFRAYDTLDESMEDHGRFLATISRYANIIGNYDYKDVCNLLQQDGYATSPTYATTLIDIIEQFELYKYDSGLFRFSAKVSGGDFDRLSALCKELQLETDWEAW